VDYKIHMDMEIVKSA